MQMPVNKVKLLYGDDLGYIFRSCSDKSIHAAARSDPSPVSYLCDKSRRGGFLRATLCSPGYDHTAHIQRPTRLFVAVRPVIVRRCDVTRDGGRSGFLGVGESVGQVPHFIDQTHRWNNASKWILGVF